MKQNKVLFICVLFVLGGIHTTYFGIKSISVLHEFVSGITLVVFGLLCILFGAVSFIENK